MIYLQNYVFPLPSNIYVFCCYYVHNYYSHVIFFGFFVMVMMVVAWLCYGNSFKFDVKRSDSRMIELFLQIMVINFLVLMAGPGFWLIQYQGRMFRDSELTLKAIGHQWYWSYEYGDSGKLCFDSFMKPLDELNFGEFRLFDVDNRCVLPMMTNIGLYCTSSDVIHSFAVPSCFVKIDALNGLLTKVSLNFSCLGMFYGQCSEICGSGHSFMPIVLEVTSMECWKGWSLGLLLE
uniref:cytochrome c oxidase subunit II n=1 Tax=Mansonella sp. 'DEUX' TaxID=1719275 RepID=UPI002551E16C|nr:cytochrome c oxidase subunit II [Mansonella sp. 'DEUX']WGC93689.1 cytochrome c oxidase subunit II [Mansonella sp. 'DEUX']WGC93701.1 cytochrome c oxidase subunit II [Mansonella sp. 'DEUX']